MKKNFNLKTTLLLLSLFFAISSFAQKAKKGDKAEKSTKGKYIENKKYNVQFYEMKATGRGKAVASTVVTKSGKIESDMMTEKIKAPSASYNVLIDSTYMEDDAESHLVKIEAIVNSDKDEITWEATVTNADIEGTVVLKKNGVDKKKYEFSGSEKTKK